MENHNDKFSLASTRNYSPLKLKTLTIRVLIIFKLKSEAECLFNSIPRTLSTEFRNFCKLFGKYMFSNGTQSIWKSENGGIKLIDKFSFDSSFKSKYSAYSALSARNIGETLIVNNFPFLLKLESSDYGNNPNNAIAILVSNRDSYVKSYEMEHFAKS